MLKNTGIVRPIDELGRIVIPKELRTTLDLKVGSRKEPGDSLAIYVDGDQIVLRKYQPGCVITGNQEELVEFNGKLYSREAIRKLAAKAGIYTA